MTRKTIAEPRCANGIRCVSYHSLGEPGKLSRGNPGPRCFACEERRVASELKMAANRNRAVKREKAEKSRRARSNRLVEHVSRERTEAERAREVLELRRKSVLTCERGLRSALASGNKRLVRRWSRSLREAKDRLAWAEADLARTEKKVWSDQAS